MDIEYAVRCKVILSPTGKPWVKLCAGDQQFQCQLTSDQEFEFDFVAKNSAELTIEHYGKSNSDPTTQVVIRSISFFGIEDPKFIWAGTYRPHYPEPWFSQQTTRPSSELTAVSCLGWNGIYSLRFSVPVFTWMHQVQNLGWIYQ